MQRLPPTSAAALALVLLAGCAINPVSGRLEVSLTSEAREIEIGRRLARDVEQQVGVLPDSQLTRYVAAVGQRLVQASPRRSIPYSFQVLDLPEPNAFALPGGVVYVSRGLLLIANSEDEIAGVIAHEIGHVAARHAVQRMTRAAPLQLLTGVAAGVTSIVSDDVAGALAGAGGLANAALNAPFDREQENEADEVGQKLAAADGWDPAAVTTLLQTLGRAERAAGDRGDGGFLSTHPSTPERIARTRARAGGLPRAAPRPLVADRRAFLALLEGLVVGPDPSHGVFDDSTFIQPRLGYRLVFPRGWQTGHTRTVAAAISPAQDAIVLLQPVGRGTAAGRAREALATEGDGSPEVELVPLRIGGEPAVSCELSTQDVRAQLTWVERGGDVYLVVGLAAARRYPEVRADFTASAASFGALTDRQRDAVSVVRLRIVTARDGERLSSLLARRPSAMGAAQVAWLNGLGADPVLQAGQSIKVPVRERYAPR